MPFAEKFKPVFDNHIRAVCDKLGYSVQRADDIFRPGNIMDDIWSMIYNAKKVIVECTSRNPNVFYELGISDTIGKDVIIITQNKDDIPFDLRHRRYIKYVFTPKGMKDECSLGKTDKLRVYWTKSLTELHKVGRPRQETLCQSSFKLRSWAAELVA